MSGENCLTGLKVLDLTQFEAGPSCTEALAWMGADVVKVENPGAGDPGRSSGRTDPKVDALYFLQYNSNKRSVAVNLKDPRGLQLVKDLVKNADVMIENFAPGAIERLGLGYDVVKAINPSIIFCQIKGFGTGSPYEKGLAFDMIAQACGGLMSVTGEEDGPPCKPGATIGDTGTGMIMAISILGAYIRRLRTGQGEHLQLAMQDSILHYIRNAFAYMERTDGKAAPRAGSKTVGGGNPPIGVYPCKGGGPNDYVYIYTSAANPEHWTRLLKVMGREDLIGDERYATPAGTGDNANPKVIAGRELIPHLRQLVIGISVQGVQNLRPIEGDDAQRPLIFDDAETVGHSAMTFSSFNAPIAPASIFSQSARTAPLC